MFTRRFAVMPSIAVLLAVSGAVIIDSPPPVAAGAAPFGKICVVGETEDGPFNTPTDLLTSTDQPTIFGGLGYTYGSTKYKYACARRSGGTEYWNGNTWVQTTKLAWAGLCFIRVDTSVGQIALTPRAFVQGTLKAPFNVPAGTTFIFTPNGTSAVTVTFAGTAATHTSTAGTFTSFVGGETLTLTFDDGSATTVTFQPGDNTLGAIVSRINTAFGVVLASNASSQLKLSTLRLGSGAKLVIAAGSAATTLGLTAGTYSGTGDAVDLSAMTFAELRTKVQAASALVLLTQAASGFPRVTSKLGGTGTVAIGAGTANGVLGFATTGSAATANTSALLSIPAGTRASVGGAEALRVVTMQTTAVALGSAATVLLKVRPAVDDGSFAGTAVSTVDTLEDNPADGEWQVGNPVLLTPALTAAQLDSVYLAAVASAVGVGNDVTRRISGIVSARQSSAIRAAVRQNAIDTAANGHQGRRAFICPPNGTTASVAIGSTTSGVQPYRAEEVTFALGGVRCFLQEMIDGGYHSNGEVIRHPDTLLAARWSVLPPGFNPGQLPEEVTFRYSPLIFPGLETAALGWDVPAYAAFKTAGICASFFDKDMGVTFEEGITAVDPLVDPSRVNIGRKTLADLIGDTCANMARPRAKRQATEEAREALQDSFDLFLGQLAPEAAKGAAVIKEFFIKRRTDGLPPGLVEYLVAASEVGSDNVFLINLKVGPNAVQLSR